MIWERLKRRLALRPERLGPEAVNLWQVASKLALYRQTLGWEVYLFVPRRAFEVLKPHFEPEGYRPGHWRTPGTGWHLHAVEEGAMVNIHVDSHNPASNMLAMARHFMRDVVVTSFRSSVRYRKAALRPFYRWTDGAVTLPRTLRSAVPGMFRMPRYLATVRRATSTPSDCSIFTSA